MTAKQVVVIGAGVIGAACAHYLARRGCRVTLVERGQMGGGCSHANCGFVCPSHALPLAGPGAIAGVLRTLFRRNSPLAVRWRCDPALWGWLWRFARRCHPRALHDAALGIHALLQSSRSLYEELFAAGLDAEWQTNGLLFVFQTREAHRHYAATDRVLRERYALPAERFDGPDLNRLEPALHEGLAGGWLYRGDAQLRPERLMASWRRQLEAQGVVIREKCAFVKFLGRGSRTVGVRTSLGDLRADAVVVATGAWTPLLHGALGIRLPIEPGKGYSITTARPDPCPGTPMIFEEHRVAVTPFEDAFRLGSTMEFAGYDTTLNRRRLDLLTRGAAPYLRAPVGCPVTEEWWGWRPMTPDGKPFISRVPKYENAWIAAGHGMLGLSMAPATGRLIAEMVSGFAPHLPPAWYAVNRR